MPDALDRLTAALADRDRVEPVLVITKGCAERGYPLGISNSVSRLPASSPKKGA